MIRVLIALTVVALMTVALLHMWAPQDLEELPDE